MKEVDSRVEEVLQEYIRPNSTLSAAEEIYTRLTNESVEFTRWEEVSEYFSNMSMSDEEFNELLLIAKDVVEAGVTQMSESYLGLTESVDTTTAIDALEEGGEKVKDISYKLDEDGEIESRIIYEVYSFDITSYGEMERLVEEKSVQFRILPQINLVIVETTYPPHVQRLKSVLSDLNLDAISLPAAEYIPDRNIIQDFLNQFEHRDSGLSKTPTIMEVSEVRLKNPEQHDEAIREVRFTGDDMIGHARTSELLEEGWMITGLGMKVSYENSIFDVNVGSSPMLTYITVDNIGTVNLGRRLLDELRDRYLSVIPRTH